MYKHTKKILVIALALALVAVAGGVGSVAAFNLDENGTANASVTIPEATYSWKYNATGTASMDGMSIVWKNIDIEVDASETGIPTTEGFEITYNKMECDLFTIDEVLYSDNEISENEVLDTIYLTDGKANLECEDFTINGSLVAGTATLTLTCTASLSE